MLQLFKQVLTQPPHIPDDASPSLKTFLQGMLERDPKKRFTMKDIKASVWLSGQVQAASNPSGQTVLILRCIVEMQEWDDLMAKKVSAKHQEINDNKKILDGW